MHVFLLEIWIDLEHFGNLKQPLSIFNSLTHLDHGLFIRGRGKLGSMQLLGMAELLSLCGMETPEAVFHATFPGS